MCHYRLIRDLDKRISDIGERLLLINNRLTEVQLKIEWTKPGLLLDRLVEELIRAGAPWIEGTKR